MVNRDNGEKGGKTVAARVHSPDAKTWNQKATKKKKKKNESSNEKYRKTMNEWRSWARGDKGIEKEAVTMV